MKNVAVVMAAVVMLSFPAHADDTGGVQPATMEKYQKVKQQVEALAGTPAASLAPEVATEAARSVAAAQEGLKAGNDRVTHEAVETEPSEAVDVRMLMRMTGSSRCGVQVVPSVDHSKVKPERVAAVPDVAACSARSRLWPGVAVTVNIAYCEPSLTGP